MLYLNRMHNYTDTYYYYIFKHNTLSQIIVTFLFQTQRKSELNWSLLLHLQWRTATLGYTQHIPEHPRPIVQNSQPIPWSTRQEGRTASATQSVTFYRQSMLQWNILNPTPKGVYPTDFTWKKGKGVCLPSTMFEGVDMF